MSSYQLTHFPSVQIIPNSNQEIRGLRQQPGQCPSKFAEKLSKKTLGCGYVYTEAKIPCMFIDGLTDDLRTRVMSYWSEKRGIIFDFLCRYAIYYIPRTSESDRETTKSYSWPF